MNTLAEVARDLQLGAYVRLGRGEEGTGGRDKPSILADTLEAVIGATYIDCGLDAASGLVHRLFDPVIERSALLGAGLDWKTSLQELTADRGLGVPEYQVKDSGPDHQKLFRAVVKVGGRELGAGEGRSKKAAEQLAAEAAYRAITAETATQAEGSRPGSSLPARPCQSDRPLTGPLAGAAASPILRCSPGSRRRCRMPELPEVETVRAGLERHVVGRTIATARCCNPRAVRRDPAGPAASPPRWPAAPSCAPNGAASTSGSPGRRGLRLRRRRAPDGSAARPPGHERPAPRRRPGPPLSPHVRARFTFTDGGPDLRFTDQRTFGHLMLVAALGYPGRPGGWCPRRSRISRPTRSRPPSTRRLRGQAGAAEDRDQARTARPVADQRDRQHLRRRGAVAGAAALGPADRDPPPGRGIQAARRGPRGADRGAQGGRDVLRRALRERERGERLLRPVAERLRPRGRALRPLRHADPPGRVHEPLLV